MTMDKRKALGRGLDALLPSKPAGGGTSRADATAAAPTAALTAATGSSSSAAAATAAAVLEREAGGGPGVVEIPVDQIDRSPYQTRHKMPEQTLAELAASIRATGVVQPVLVRPTAGGRYELIAGERRWLASQRAGKTTVPAIVRQVSNEQAAEMTIIENLQREDLNPMEQARAFEKLSREFGLTQEEMARKTGVERSTIANFLRLLKLPFEVQMNIENGPISFGHAKVLMMLTDTEQIKKVGAKIVKDALSVRQLEDVVFDLMNPIEGQAAAVRPQKYVDPNVRAAEQELTRMLGARVQIKDRNGRGKIVITYRSLAEFDRVLSYIVAKRH
ncbi:MAG TPA: ParB/RepB/Spo0J family partition protein [Terriglobales bacterium]|nr:ParB/RepB/Spo0J family partition protein [Terriglobales bacterium]